MKESTLHLIARIFKYVLRACNKTPLLARWLLRHSIVPNVLRGDLQSPRAV
jgi:hypothetical protein